MIPIAVAAALAVAAAPAAAIEKPTGPVLHRLTLVSAYSCTYCRVLDMNGMTGLRAKWLPRGLQIETVPFILSPTDVPATIAARCGPASGFVRRSTIMFRAQSQIAGNWTSADGARRAAAVRKGDPSAIAALAGIDGLAPSLGLARAQLAACLADPARRRSVEEASRDAVQRLHVAGTPTAFLDGRPIAASWPAIDADVAKAFR